MEGRRRKGAFSLKSVDFGILEKELEDSCATMMALLLNLLKSITHNFSEEPELGRGGFTRPTWELGKMIAVKKLHDMLLDNIQLYSMNSRVCSSHAKDAGMLTLSPRCSLCFL
ncbi:unnamed protein product [Urochloa humidicola]